MTERKLTAQTLAASLNSKEQIEQLKALIDRLTKGKPREGDILEFRQMLAKVPGLWRTFVDLAEVTSDDLIEKIVGKAPMGAESLKRGRLELQAELGYETASGLERLLIESAIITWLRYTDTERRYTQVVMGGESLTLPQAAWWEKRLSGAQHRYLRSCECLARVRRLLRLPLLQVNVSRQAVNVAGTLVAGAGSGQASAPAGELKGGP